MKDELASELQVLSNVEFYLKDLDEKIDVARKRLEAECSRLSCERKKAANKLDKNVTKILQELGMKHAEFKTSISASEPSFNGYDEVEFMLLSNLGESMKALRDIASGGEVSRILLALKTVLADVDSVPVSIFDEIDSNVGGQIALSVGRKLRQIAKTRQVVCVTHLPQIACLGDVHLGVIKRSQKGRTRMYIEKIEGEQRVEEMARMLGGDKLTSVAKHYYRQRFLHEGFSLS